MNNIVVIANNIVVIANNILVIVNNILVIVNNIVVIVNNINVIVNFRKNNKGHFRNSERTRKPSFQRLSPFYEQTYEQPEQPEQPLKKPN